MRNRPSINEVWTGIEGLEVVAFEIKTGKPFTFAASGSVLCPIRTDCSPPRLILERPWRGVHWTAPVRSTASLMNWGGRQ